MTIASTTANKPQDRAVKGAVVALCLLTAMNFVNYLDRYILPAVQEQVKREFHLSESQIGSLTLWFFVAYVLSSPVTGWLGDRFPRKPMIVVAALMIAAMNFWTAGVHSYLSLNLRHAALGIGEASFGIFAPALLADYFADDKRNAVLTIFNVAIPVGAALGYLSGGVVAAHHGWRMAFVVSAIPGALIALLILFFMREPQRAEAKDRKKVDKASVMSLLRNKAYLCSILGYAAVTFSLGGISWWMPSFLNRVDGRSLEAAGTIMGGITVVCGLGGTVTGGLLAHWWSKKTSKALYLVPALSAVLAVPPSPATTIIGPITPPADSIENPASLCRNAGIHHEIPPSEKVTAEYPRIALKYALFLNSDEAVPFASFAFSTLPDRAGSLIIVQISNPTSAPGTADATKLIRHP